MHLDSLCESIANIYEFGADSLTIAICILLAFTTVQDGANVSEKVAGLQVSR